MNRAALAGAFVAALLALGFGVGATAAQSRAAQGASKASHNSSGETGAEEKLREILKNQEQILANQATILQKFDAVMEELRIIKVRATIMNR